MTKKILAVLLAVVLVLTCGVVAFAEDTTSEPAQKIVVTFDPNTGSGTMEPIEVTNGAIVLPECEYTVVGDKEFVGWSEEKTDAVVLYQPGETFKTTESVTLYAQWAVSGYVEYFVYYDANGGEGETIDDMGYLADSFAMAAFNEFTAPLDHLAFYHWNTKADNTGDEYDEFDEIHVVDQDITLYAIWWDPETQTIYNPNGSTNNAPVEPSEPEVEVPETDSDVVTETDIPKTGDASAMAIALAVGAVAMGALVVLKKKD